MQFDNVTKMMSYFTFMKFHYIVIILFWKTTNWPSHATSNHQDAKSPKLSNIFT